MVSNLQTCFERYNFGYWIPNKRITVEGLKKKEILEKFIASPLDLPKIDLR